MSDQIRQYDQLSKKIQKIIKTDFHNVNKRKLPEILKYRDIKYGVIQNKYLIMIYFIKPKVQNEVDGYYKIYKEPFPGLFSYPNFEISSAFSIENSKNNYFKNNKVSNLYSFKIGKDSSFILENHNQVIRSPDGFMIDYVIDLAYVIFFGDIINISNFTEYLDDLIKYSIKIWKER